MFNFLKGPGGFQELLRIAIPIFVSNGAFSVMLFTDKLFVARLGKEHLAATMAGGLTSFASLSFFFGFVSFSTAVVAQYYGSAQKKLSAATTFQILYLIVVFYPLILCMIPGVLIFFQKIGHHPLQVELETSYFRILSIGSVFTLMRMSIASFFSGIGRTKIVMFSSVIGMTVNIPINYILIFGKCGLPELGIQGAAIGTNISSICMLIILLSHFLGASNRREFQIDSMFNLDMTMIKRLLRFGFPSGAETFLNILAFNIFILLFHTYSSDVAAAITLVFNWDLLYFIPMLGLSVATMSLVGQQLGAKNTTEAQRAVRSGLILALCFAIGAGSLFLFASRFLIELFVTEEMETNFLSTVSLAIDMLRITSLFVIFNAFSMIYSATLKSAGDTIWVMRTTIIVNWIMLAGELILIKIMTVSPIHAWLFFVVCMAFIPVLMYFRYVKGKWLHIQMIK